MLETRIFFSLRWPISKSDGTLKNVTIKDDLIFKDLVIRASSAHKQEMLSKYLGGRYVTKCIAFYCTIHATTNSFLVAT